MKNNSSYIYQYINRDISWFSFNYRILLEAKDHNPPAYERLKFLAIYSSNIDEFYKMRVTSYRSILELTDKLDIKNLLIPGFNMKEELLRKTDREIKHTREGKKGRIILKMNGFQHREMINKLYDASEAGDPRHS